MRRPWRYLVVAAAATAVLVGAGLVALGRGSDDGGTTPGAARPSPTGPLRTTPLSAYDTSTVALERGAFCDRVDPRLVEVTLGGAPTSQRSWGDGDDTVLTAGVTDVAHEFGCEYVGPAGVTARAWVFAPPVGRAQARRWATQQDGATGATCATADATFGSPSALLTCQGDQEQSATYRGLFGDAWLSCEIDAPPSTPAPDLVDTAGRWCVGVAQAARAR